MKVPKTPPKPNTPSADVATQQWVSTYYATKSSGATTYRKNASNQVVNTITETDLLNGEIMVGAGAIGPTGTLRLTAWGDIQNNTGATQSSPRFKLKLGGTTLVDTGVISAIWVNHTDNRPWRLVAEVTNQSSAKSQEATVNLDGYFAASTSGSVSFATGDGLHSVANSLYKIIGGGINQTVDTTVVCPLVFSVILPVASASLNVTLRDALVEII